MGQKWSAREWKGQNSSTNKWEKRQKSFTNECSWLLRQGIVEGIRLCNAEWWSSIGCVAAEPDSPDKLSRTTRQLLPTWLMLSCHSTAASIGSFILVLHESVHCASLSARCSPSSPTRSSGFNPHATLRLFSKMKKEEKKKRLDRRTAPFYCSVD